MGQRGPQGVLFFPSGSCAWFSLQLVSADFQAMQIPMHEDLQKDISSLEALAQIALVYIAVHSIPFQALGFRFGFPLFQYRC